MIKLKKFILCAGLTATGFVMLLAPKKTSAEAGDIAFYNVVSTQKSMPSSKISKINELKVAREALMSKITSYMGDEVKIESGGGDGEETQTLPEGTTSVIIKQGNGTVVVWSETPLADLNQYRTDYLADPTRDPSIKMDDQFVPISGYGTYDLNPTLGNPWHTYTFGVNSSGQSYFAANGNAYSHINAQTNPTPTPKITPTPTPTNPNATPTPTDPNATPTPTNPNGTPEPTPTNYYPQTGDNSHGDSVIAGTLTFLTLGAATAVGYVLAKRKKIKRGY
jgi:cell division septation protein DedD